jgi:hypothetical protein
MVMVMVMVLVLVGFWCIQSYVLLETEKEPCHQESKRIHQPTKDRDHRLFKMRGYENQ